MGCWTEPLLLLGRDVCLGRVERMVHSCEKTLSYILAAERGRKHESLRRRKEGLHNRGRGKEGGEGRRRRNRRRQ